MRVLIIENYETFINSRPNIYRAEVASIAKRLSMGRWAHYQDLIISGESCRVLKSKIELFKPGEILDRDYVSLITSFADHKKLKWEK